MKLNRWIFFLAVVFSQLLSPSFQEEEDDYRIVSVQKEVSDGGESVLLDPPLEPGPTEEIETRRRIRVRTGVKRRRRLRKRIRTTEHPPGDTIDILTQPGNYGELESVKAFEEVYSTLPPLEETTMRKRTHKRRRRPHRKHRNKTSDGRNKKEDDNGETTTRKPHRKRRKGGRRRPRPTAQMITTEMDKIELYIETTVIPPEDPTTVIYDPNNRALEKLEQEEKNGRIYQVFDSRNNLVSQPTAVEESIEPTKLPEFKVETTPQPVTWKLHKYRPYGTKSSVNAIKPVKEYTIETDSRFTVNTIKPVKTFSDEPPEHQTEYNRPSTNTIKPFKVIERPADNYRPSSNTIKTVRQFGNEFPADPANKEPNEVPSQAPTVSQIRSDFGNKVFDRKALFSKSRKLPETSAIIRKKLSPRLQQNNKNGVDTRPKLADTTVKYVTESKQSYEGYYTTTQPQLMEASRLIERLTAHAQSYRTAGTTTPSPTTFPTTPTPNIPKFEPKKEKPTTTLKPETTTKFICATTKVQPTMRPTTMKPTTEMIFKERFNKVIELHRSRGKSIFTTPKYDAEPTTLSASVIEIESTEPNEIEQLPPEIQTTDIPQNLNFDILNLRQLNDSITELLKTESGNLKLSKILELRNMTLAQLLDHRERGSSKFVLADIFAEKKSLVGENTTSPEGEEDDNEGERQIYVKPTILFPNDDVMGTFPSFLSDKIQGVQQKSKSDTKGYYTTLKAIVRIDNREPRVFDSMPEFSTPKRAESPLRKMPSPQLKPVSLRGKYEEIKISMQPTPKTEKIDNVFVIDEKDHILETNQVASNLEADLSSSEDNFSRFRKIPVSVKSAIVISLAIFVLAIFGFLSLLISCRVRQKKSRLRAKRGALCEHLKNEEFMNSQQSLSPVLNKQQRRAYPHNSVPSNGTTTRHYYLWRTLRKTFQYD